MIRIGTESVGRPRREQRTERKLGRGEGPIIMHDGGVGLPTLNRLGNSSKYGVPEGPSSRYEVH